MLKVSGKNKSILELGWFFGMGYVLKGGKGGN
jgi:hypothetical protein